MSARRASSAEPAPIALRASAIRLEGATETFRTGRGEIAALGPIDLEVREGEFLAVLGPSGCGKSTLLRLVAGLLPPSSGRVLVAGREVRAPVTALGFVFQKPVLLPWRDVLGNVLIQLELRGRLPPGARERARALLAAVGLEGFERARPFELSGGMQQRAALARALIHDPPLLLMDEPFGALDALTREQLRIDLEELWLRTRKTVLFVTHAIDEAVLLADRVVVLGPRPGRIERVMPVPIPRPRGLAGRRDPAFAPIVEAITRVFLERGVLHGTGRTRLAVLETGARNEEGKRR
ncbi:MAG: ABC transporter ATP-binding protein [Geminicoccaceae bacterium]|nr:ABC transporter ATP-binding protein [Geminicoccaceae bacterium]MDW8342437.1 ABC transporter ATP-binding protein [Geminicoccaceae bacterium]